MGMYDEFIIKIPIQCPNCYHGSFNRFQTKQLDCSLDIYTQGEPANVYGFRAPNEFEIKEHEIYNQIFSIGISIFDDFPVVALDKTNIIKTLPDGKYLVYEYCHNCESMMHVSAVIKDGIFIGVEI